MAFPTNDECLFLFCPIIGEILKSKEPALQTDPKGGYTITHMNEKYIFGVGLFCAYFGFFMLFSPQINIIFQCVTK